MLRIHLRRAIVFGLLAAILFGAISTLMPKTYEARAQILVGGNLQETFTSRSTNVNDDIFTILQRGQPQNFQTELQVLKSQEMYFAAVQRVAQQRANQAILQPDWLLRTYLEYDVTSEPNSSFGIVTVRTDSPQLSADIANAVLVEYDAQLQRRANFALDNALAVLRSQVESAQTEMNTAENQLRQAREQSQTPDAGLRASQLSSEQAQLNAQVAGLRSQLSGATAAVAAIRAQLAGTAPTVKASDTQIRNPIIDTLEARLAELRSQRGQLTARYEPDAPQVKEIDGAINDVAARLQNARRAPFSGAQRSDAPNPVYQQLQQQLASAIANESSLREQVSSVERSLNDVAARLAQLPAVQNTLATRLREFEIAQRRYVDGQQLLKTLTDRNSAGWRAPQTNPARANEDPVAPDIPRWIVLGALAGISFGLLFSFGLESLRFRVYNSAQLTELTGVPVAAALPKSATASGARVNAIIATRKEAPIAEGLKYMAFSTLLAGESRYRRVMFTGVGTGVGTSSCALQYAVALARTGTRVLLVDCDLRFREISRAFEADGKTGVSDIVGRTALPTEETPLAVETIHPDLSLVPAGVQGERTLTSVATSHVLAMLEAFDSISDVVVIDAPACDQYADAARLAGLVDQVLLVVGSQKTGVRQVPMAKELLVGAGAKDVKIILTNTNAGEEALTLAPTAMRQA